MDIETITRKFSGEEPKRYNKNFIKKLVLSNCTIDGSCIYSIKSLLDFVNDDELSEEQKKELMDLTKKIYKEKRNEYSNFLDDLFGVENKKQATVDSEVPVQQQAEPAEEGDY